MNKLSRKNIKNKKNRSRKYRLKNLKGGASANANAANADKKYKPLITYNTSTVINENYLSANGSREPTIFTESTPSLQSNTSLKSSDTAKQLLDICREACDIMQPMILAFYKKINNNTKVVTEQSKKDDKSDFTVVDALVQYFLQYILFNDKFKAIIGEEDLGENGTKVNIDSPDNKFYVINDTPDKSTPNEKLYISPEFNNYINGEDSIKKKLLKLREEKFKDIHYHDKYVVIDPIDGTTEFTTNHGQQSTICIGFSNVDNGLPWAGIVYRPIPPSIKEPYDYTYIYGCSTENLCKSKKNTDADELDFIPTIKQGKTNTLLTSNKDLSPFLMAMIDTAKTTWSRVNSGGAGNKMLKLLEGEGEAYIQDRGLSRWDTCAAQAIIEAAGGKCCKLTNFISNEDLISYIYKESDYNLDFITNPTYKPQFTLYNINDNLKKELKKIIIKKTNVISHITKYEKNRLNNQKNTISKNDKTKLLKKINTTQKQSILRQNKYLIKQFTDTHYNVKYFKPYSNLCGIVAFLDTTKKEDYFSLCKKAEKISPPEYD